MHPQSLSCVQLCDPYDCSPPGSSVHKNFQVRIVEWFAIFYSRRSARPRDWTQVSSITGGFFIIWATREAPKGGLGFTLNQGFYIHAWVSFHLSFKPKASFINWEHSFHRVWRKPEGLCDALSSCCLSTGAQFSSVQFSPSVMSSSLWAKDCSRPSFPVHHLLPELTQADGYPVGDAIQPSHPLSCPSPPAFNLSQYQGLFQRVSSSHQEAKVLEFQLQHQSFQWIFRTDFLYNWLVWSPCSPRTLKSFLQHHSSQKHQFFGAQLSL